MMTMKKKAELIFDGGVIWAFISLVFCVAGLALLVFPPYTSPYIPVWLRAIYFILLVALGRQAFVGEYRIEGNNLRYFDDYLLRRKISITNINSITFILGGYKRSRVLLLTHSHGELTITIGKWSLDTPYKFLKVIRQRNNNVVLSKELNFLLHNYDSNQNKVYEYSDGVQHKEAVDVWKSMIPIIVLIALLFLIAYAFDLNDNKMYMQFLHDVIVSLK